VEDAGYVEDAGAGYVEDAGDGYVGDAGAGYVGDAGAGYAGDAGAGYAGDAGAGYVGDAGAGYVGVVELYEVVPAEAKANKEPVKSTRKSIFYGKLSRVKKREVSLRSRETSEL
jgi:hypothetical protein